MALKKLSELHPNIWSGNTEDELCASLAFDNQKYPIVTLHGKLFPNAEAAYQFYKFNVATGKRHILRMKLAKARFKQYPDTFFSIRERGGLDWLSECQHTLPNKTSNTYWEGIGLESPLICCLAEAYRRLCVDLGLDDEVIDW